MRKKRLGSYKNPSVSFKHFDDFIAPCIKLGVFLLQLRMGKDVINTAANTLVKACRGTEARDGTLELAAVKDDSRSLVAEEITREVPLLRTGGSKEVGGDMM
jgi:hypothetical protein